MSCRRCGSYAINHKAHGRDGSDADLCDVCYWRKRAVLASPLPDDLIEQVLDALRIGEDAVRPISLYGTHERGDKIRAAIAILKGKLE